MTHAKFLEHDFRDDSDPMRFGPYEVQIKSYAVGSGRNFEIVIDACPYIVGRYASLGKAEETFCTLSVFDIKRAIERGVTKDKLACDDLTARISRGQKLLDSFSKKASKAARNSDKQKPAVESGHKRKPGGFSAPKGKKLRGSNRDLLGTSLIVSSQKVLLQDGTYTWYEILACGHRGAMIDRMNTEKLIRTRRCDVCRKDRKKTV